ncbi:hypothetical protein L227DRAFT_610506 [Lentinus tigrinus ALCF2SS1-6]|uniref:Uncharacterized protein n=1 Tax=Lentinus tigrinus ALCF2SS1-6 TaxID=1328759 RepID=A0A5C2SJA0_9APHY|nr:hypothetical protein L227DRAFT_610506 [Lentinus tigrinus ALCF2SS1-6]
MVPLLSRGLSEKLTATRRKVAVIVDNMAKLVDSPVAVRPFIPKLLPGRGVPHGDGSDLPPLKKADEKHLAHSLIDLYKKAGANPVPSVADVGTI